MTIDRRKFLAGTALGAVTAVLLNKQEAKAGNVSGYKPRFATRTNVSAAEPAKKPAPKPITFLPVSFA